MKYQGALIKDSEIVKFVALSVATDELRKEGSKFYTHHC
jgi:hypothetical protein